jgi:hypothetical protein
LGWVGVAAEADHFSAKPVQSVDERLSLRRINHAHEGEAASQSI